MFKVEHEGMTVRDVPELWTGDGRAIKIKIKLTINGCWEVISHVPNRNGYIELYRNHKIVRAHRLSYKTFCGPIPQGLYVLHHCDNPPCINPNHLYVGTQTDNMRDCRLRGRMASQKGAKNGNAKLSEKDVLNIFNSDKKGSADIKSLSRKYSVTKETISQIIRGVRWNHLTERI